MLEVQGKPVDPPAGPFNDIAVGKEATATVTIKSTGSSNLKVNSITHSGADAAHFELRNKPAADVGVPTGTTVTFDVVYKPTAVGNHAATIQIASNADGAPHSFDAKGVAKTPPALDMGANLAAPSTQQGTESAELSIPVRNTGDLELKIQGFSLTSGDTGDFVVKTDPGVEIKLAKNAAGSIKVTFKPGSAGAKTAVLTVPSNDPASPKTITLTGTATP
jgi:hypothetical protein